MSYCGENPIQIPASVRARLVRERAIHGRTIHGRRHSVRMGMEGLGGLGALGAVAAGWIPTRLFDGDSLASLASAYKLTAEQIALGNDVAFSSSAISGEGGWVQRTGGKLLVDRNGNPVPLKKDGKIKLERQYVFTSNSVIFLPPGGPRPPADGSGREPSIGPPGSSRVNTAGVGPLAVFLLAGAAAWWWFEGRDKKKKPA